VTDPVVVTNDSEVETRIRARMEAEMADPEWQASMSRSLADIRAGRVLPWQIAFLPLPGWVFHILFRYVAPWTWGRATRKL
jgi:hypothetical protein